MDACAMDGGEMDYLQFLTVLRRVKELRAEEATAEKVRVTDRRSVTLSVTFLTLFTLFTGLRNSKLRVCGAHLGKAYAVGLSAGSDAKLARASCTPRAEPEGGHVPRQQPHGCGLGGRKPHHHYVQHVVSRFPAEGEFRAYSCNVVGENDFRRGAHNPEPKGKADKGSVSVEAC